MAANPPASSRATGIGAKSPAKTHWDKDGGPSPSLRTPTPTFPHKGAHKGRYFSDPTLALVAFSLSHRARGRHPHPYQL
jgi:hypothetical protein